MGSHRITVIDDSPEILDVLGDALRRADVEVSLLDARATLDDIAATSPDVVMVDLRLGTDHLPGWEIVRSLRDHPALLEVPVIVCSGALDQMRGYGGAMTGPRTYLLPKPFSLHDLESVMAEALGSSAPVDAPPPPGAIPDFGSDPVGWFSWVQGEMGTPRWRPVLDRTKPGTWISEAGHPWRVVKTARGVEIRPELVSPFLRYGNQPMVSALALTDEIEIELTTQQSRWVDRFPCRTFDLAALGRAMIEERKLPHDNLPQLFPADADQPQGTTISEAFSSFGVGEPTESQLQR